MDGLIIKLSKSLEKRGFETQICEDVESAEKIIHGIISKSESVSSIGFGNSMTIRSMGLHNSLLKYTNNLFVHAPVGTEKDDRKALTADFYLTSANAISLDGHIINIDGTGNRTAATCFGPKHVIYLVGKNKIAKNIDDAIKRAKSAAVELAKRYNRKTPCVVSGKCEDCVSPESICAVTTIHRKKPYGVKVSVIIINEDMGL